MENISKKNEKQKPMLPGNIFYKFDENINKKEKINFNIISKNNNNFSKKRKKKEWLINKKHKTQKLYNSKKNYISIILYNKLFFILIFFMIFFYISSTKQNPALNQSLNSELIITISGPGKRSIFNEDFQYKPDAIFINGNKTNLEETLDYNNFEMKNVENIIKIYYSNPPESLGNMFSCNDNIKKVDLTHFDTSKVNDMNNMFSNCN